MTGWGGQSRSPSLPKAWPTGPCHLWLGLLETQFGNHFENRPEASCFANENNELQSREQGRHEPPPSPGLESSLQSSGGRPSRLEPDMMEKRRASLLTRFGSPQSTGMQDPEHESGVLQDLCGRSPGGTRLWGGARVSAQRGGHAVSDPLTGASAQNSDFTAPGGWGWGACANGPSSNPTLCSMVPRNLEINTSRLTAHFRKASACSSAELPTP